MFALKRYAALAAFLFCAPVLAQPDPPTDLRAIVGVCVPDSLGNIDTRHCDGDDGDLKPSIPVLGPMVVYPTQLDVTLLSGSTGGTAPYTQDLWCGPGAGTLVEVATGDLFATVSYHSWTGRTASTLYDCQLRTVGADGRRSNFSTIVSASTLPSGGSLPGAPGAQSCDSLSTTTITCSWSAASGTVFSYNVILGTCSGGVEVSSSGTIIDTTASTSYQYVGLTPGAEYYTRQSANNSGGAGPANARDCTTVDSGAPPDGNVVFRDTFNGRPNGFAWGTSSWRGRPAGLSQSNPFNGTGVNFNNATPVSSGFGTYLETIAVKQGANVFRTEYWYVGTPYSSPRVALTNVGSDGLGGSHYRGAEYWYGFWFCLDELHANSPQINAAQWHDDDNGPGPAGWYHDDNPMISLSVTASSIRVFLENNADSTSGANATSPVLETNPVGKCYRVIWNLIQDSRTDAQGSEGKLRIWLIDGVGNDSAPKWEWLNKQTGKSSGVGGNTYSWYQNIGGYESLWRWSVGLPEGATWEARYDNYTVMDATGSYEAMLAALNTAN